MEVVNVKVKHIRPTFQNLQEWMEDPNHVYIGRPGIVFIEKQRFPKQASPWANPYKVGNDRNTCLELYEKWLREKLSREGIDQFKLLSNKILGCWCKPENCHGDIIIKVLAEMNKD